MYNQMLIIKCKPIQESLIMQFLGTLPVQVLHLNQKYSLWRFHQYSTRKISSQIKNYVFGRSVARQL